MTLNKRIFVQKKPAYDRESENLKNLLNRDFKLAIKNLKTYVIYDLYNITEDLYEKAKERVFSEVMIDQVFENIDLNGKTYIAYETLPAQYDQRSDSAMQALKLIDDKADVLVRAGKLVVIDGEVSDEKLGQIKKYLINPIESSEKDLAKMDFKIDSQMKPLRDLTGFRDYGKNELEGLIKDLSLALDLEDLEFIQSHYKKEGRDPSETEIYVLDVFWSDHCRHTTFETSLDEVKINSKLFQDEMQAAFDYYLSLREELGITKPVRLMDMASIIGKYHTKVLGDKNIEVSEEINACSFFTDIENKGKKEKWLIQFKNETHNHPSEIEPFGGASTCIGGAIRDPLSGRSYVYQAMRVSGAGNILEKREDTLANKLAQVEISKGKALGNSSYGNQIGLATTFVREIYDPSYVAKTMEVGAVVGAVKDGDYKREELVPGDIVVMIGGRTGRDGIQGASGSSVIHDDSSLTTASSQVQKGNPVEERKIQRLFRKPEVTRLIKKSNDFGAGGVSVAIGELSDGIEIFLDRVKTKYQGLNPTEIAISESQERMAVGLDTKDYEAFIKECQKENIEYVHVANITDRNRLEMYYKNEKIVDFSAEFLATAGVRKHAKAELVDKVRENPFVKKEVTKEAILDELKDLNVTNQKGMASMFDASVGAQSVMMPFAGKERITPVQASVAAIPTLYSTPDTATILAYGFIPKISKYSPFLSSIYAVLESVAKVYAVGGNRESLYFSFQEYFEKLLDDPKKWGKVSQAMLGSIIAQKEIGRPAIGGKDSMSGSFNDINVVETLISFACTPVKISDVITPDLKKIGNKLYIIEIEKDAKAYPNLEKAMADFEKLNAYIKDKKVVAAYVQDFASVSASLIKMGLGNKLGFTIDYDAALDFNPCSIVIEANSDLDFKEIGRVSEEISINGIEIGFDEAEKAYMSTLEEIYPTYYNKDGEKTENIATSGKEKRYYKEKVDDVRVVIPVFPGTNSEYDTQKAFEEAGASVKQVVFRNTRENDINDSIDEFVKEIQKSHIIAFPGGFSAGDEPDGSAKFIVNILKNDKVKKAIHDHLADKRLILGICNGFQALIKSGLIPYGEIRDLDSEDLSLFRNTGFRHISDTAITRCANTNSPWTQDFNLDDLHELVLSHGEGRLVGDRIEEFKDLAAFQYVDPDGDASMNGKYNPNGSAYAIEGMVSKDGLILGKMGHSERSYKTLYKTQTIRERQDIFKNGVKYFTR
ncbi:phosphoribosylformylglycinamidine synthase [uncultured Anaerococcus sp.]|uniref:phosphoribosylformylglycinamidine synthase n=1 Tax=uncultured Anaerococcus sp. TaxID=293428 RepID=UPI0025CCE24D|nr:phosphoribosylformylglycinamidine synthase [uncultured Anaerococcus sp.]